jgi:hypothetical protein
VQRAAVGSPISAVVSPKNASTFERRLREAFPLEVELSPGALHCWTSQQWHTIDDDHRYEIPLTLRPVEPQQFRAGQHWASLP